MTRARSDPKNGKTRKLQQATFREQATARAIDAAEALERTSSGILPPVTSVNRDRSFAVAALCAQELVVTARAIESRVSALTPETPEVVVEETLALVRATALQIAATLHELIAASVRVAAGTSRR